MTKLRIEAAPQASLPLRFLLTVPGWGLAGGLLLLAMADAPLHSRWHPATLALVHVWTLGVLGNAMFGSLLQFLPAAVGAPLRGLRGGPALHGVFNLGVLALVVGLAGYGRPGLVVAGTLLPLAFAWLMAMVVPGLVRAMGERLLRTGIGVACGFGVVAALFGGSLAWRLAIGRPWPLAAVDVHAAFGVVGWVVLLLAAVGRVVMPMFQGTGRVPARAQALWLGVAALALPVAALALRRHGWEAMLSATAAFVVASFAGTALWLQARVPAVRRQALYRFWRAGLLALLVAALAVLPNPRGGLLVGALALLVGLPLLVGGMALEIVPFVGWIALRRRVPRGVQLPGVQRLLTEPRKRQVLFAQLAAAVPLLAAVLWPQPWLARLAGLAQAVAWALHGHALAASLRAGRAFLRRAEAPA